MAREYRIRKLEPGSVRGICVECKVNPQAAYLPGRYRAVCSKCHDIKFGRPSNLNSRRRRYRNSKKDYCEKCGFVAVHTCQLDVDHIDGNHDNDDLNNHQTLCANCHRLKTYEQRWGKLD